MADDGAPVAKKPRFVADPPLDGTQLENVVRFLVAKDVGKTSMVCKTWSDDLKPPAASKSGTSVEEKDTEEPGVVNNSEAIWKQAAQNTNRHVVQALVKSTRSDETLDYHALASGALSRGVNKPEPPKPTFRIEDLIIVVEIKRKIVSKDKDDKEVVVYESVGALACNDSSPLLSKPSEYLAMEVDTLNAPVCFEVPNKLCPRAHDGDFLKWNDIWNSFHAGLKREKGLSDQGVWGLSLFPPFESCRGSMVASIFFFRRDNWRSIRLFDNVAFFLHDYEYDKTREVVSFYVAHEVCEGHQPFASNASGIQAQSVLVKNNASSIKAMVSFDITAILPERGSTDEQKWLRELRKARPADVDWTKQDDKEISDVQSLKFRIESMIVDITLDNRGDWEDTDSEDDFLLLLEGLDWK